MNDDLIAIKEGTNSNSSEISKFATALLDLCSNVITTDNSNAYNYMIESIDAPEEYYGDTSDIRLIVLMTKNYVGMSSEIIQTALSGFFTKHEIIQIDEKNRIYMFVINNEYNLKQKICDLKETIESDLLDPLEILISPVGRGKLSLRRLYKSITKLRHRLNTLNNHSNVLIYEDMINYMIVDSLDSDEFDNLRDTFSDFFLSLEADDELSRTAEEFFKYNLNLTDASKAMFIHRNTLIYRLDKIKKDTSLDLRNFNDAVKFKFLLSLY